MTRKVQLGAPSLTGKDANDVVAEAFADADYPHKVEITNLMPRNVTFPEVGGLFLRNVASRKPDVKGIVVITDHDQLQRLASSVEQIAELNKYAIALTIESLEAPKVVAEPPAAAPVAPAADATKGSDTATEGNADGAAQADKASEQEAAKAEDTAQAADQKPAGKAAKTA
ncbi:MAG: hypothetical protein WCZ20_02345, partial [Hydrogenophaga sp.]